MYRRLERRPTSSGADFAAACFRGSSYASGKSCSAAAGSPACDWRLYQGKAPLAIRTLHRQVCGGSLKSGTPPDIVLTVAADKEVRVARDEIEIIHPINVSKMLAAIAKQLSRQELADLVEFVKNCG